MFSHTPSKMFVNTRKTVEYLNLSCSHLTYIEQSLSFTLKGKGEHHWICGYFYSKMCCFDYQECLDVCGFSWVLGDWLLEPRCLPHIAGRWKNCDISKHFCSLWSPQFYSIWPCHMVWYYSRVKGIEERSPNNVRYG